MPRKQHSGVTDQRKASLHRLEDAQVLFDGGRWRGAMYLAGYAVECRLKYKLMRRWNCQTLVELEEKLGEKGIKENPFTHNLENLLQTAGARDRLRNNQLLWIKFTHTLNQWRPSWRYNPNLANRKIAKYFLESTHDVLDWVENNV